MDISAFDRVSKSFARTETRRGMLIAIAALAGLHGGEAVAKRRRGRKKQARVQTQLRAEAKPGRTVDPIGEVLIFDAGTTCDFRVRVEWAGQMILLDFGDRLIITFLGLSATLTNLETGTSLRVSIGGPEFVQFNEDGSVTVRGPGPWLFVPSHPETREAGLWLVRGLSLRTFADRQLQAIEIHGTSENLCAALA
jgi:hypothetical protein